MSQKKFRLVKIMVICFLMSSMVFFTGCISNEGVAHKDGTEKVVAHKVEGYLFLDHHINDFGELVEGEAYPFIAIDFPTYWFDEERGVLSVFAPVKPFEVNDSLMMIIGDGSSLSGAIGMGAGTMTYGVYSLPCKKSNFEILSVSEGGTVELFYMNETIFLEPGKKWKNVESYLEKSDDPYAVVNVTRTDTFVNYGFVKPENIVFES